MTSDRERMARADDFVMGRMNEAERERAEKDLERDPAFREAVMRLAQRLRGPAADGATPRGEVWRTVQTGIAALPHMNPAPPARSRRASGDAHPQPNAFAQALGGWRGAAVAVCLAAAFGIGMVAGTIGASQDRRAVALLDDAQGMPRALVEDFTDGTLHFQPLALADLPVGAVLRLWAIGDASEGAVALGTVAAAGSTRLSVPSGGIAWTARGYRLTLADAETDGSPGTALAQGPRNETVPGR
ncbi:anti-sigma factor domain-containing protein [Nitratireductor alexandrii]|uniref:anti-sigma factor domain-containing protein n=1 Tax=Nitratireductor alexandrii TaxID=2448161 RepID=UPI000FDB977B|nr:anti-sigma factor [Nitratireductor alexandrii]